MANKKISQLTTTTTADDNSWIVMNDSGNTATYRIKRVDLLSGTTEPAGMVSGTGTDSIKSADFLTSTDATASGTASLAIGKGATATGNNSIHISNGNIGATSMGNNSIWLGGGNIFDGSQHISIGYSSYHQGGSNQISIGWETATQGNNSIAIGGNYGGAANRASRNYSMTIGNGNASNACVEGIIMGNQNNIITGSGQRGIIIGALNQISSTGTNNMILGGENNSLTGTTSYTNLIGLNAFTSPVASNTTYVDKLVGIGNSTQLNTGGGTNTQTAGSKNNFVVGSGNTIGGSSSFHAVFGENNSNTNGNHALGSFIFGRNCNANNANNRWSVIFGNGCSVNATTGYVFGDNSNVNGDYGLSIGTNIVNAGRFSFAYGDGNRVISNYNLALGMDNDIESGEYNAEIGGTQHRNPSGSYNGYLAGQSNSNTTSNYSAFISGYDNEITGTGTYNSIINGSGNTISSKTRAVMLGTDNRTAIDNDTTHTENLYSFGQQYTHTTSQTGTTISVDMNQGNTHFIQATGNLDLTLTNLKEGGEYNIMVETTGNFTMSALGTAGFSQKMNTNFMNLTNTGFVQLRFVCVNGYIACWHVDLF